MVATAATLAPELMPRMSGEASGFRSRVWKVAPAAPNAKPASSPSIARGRRNCPTVNEAPGDRFTELVDPLISWSNPALAALILYSFFALASGLGEAKTYMLTADRRELVIETGTLRVTFAARP